MVNSKIRLTILLKEDDLKLINLITKLYPYLNSSGAIMRLGLHGFFNEEFLRNRQVIYNKENEDGHSSSWNEDYFKKFYGIKEIKFKEKGNDVKWFYKDESFKSVC